MDTSDIFSLSAREKFFKYLYNNNISVRELEKSGNLERLARKFGLEKAVYERDPSLMGCLNSSYELPPPEEHSLMFDRCCRYQPPHLCRLSSIEMLYVYSGQCSFIEKHTEYVFQAGDLCIFPPFTRNSCVMNHDEDIVFDVAFWPETFRSVLMAQPHNSNKLMSYFHHIFSSTDNRDENTPFITIRTEGKSPIGDYFVNMWQENLLDDPHSDLMQISLFNQICVTIMRNYPDSILLPANISQQSTAEAIVSYIEHNASGLTLRETAEHFCYTPAHLCRLIKKSTGRTFNDILHESRLTRASALLLSEDWSVDSVASHVGYASLGTFYRRFGQRFGLSPAEYRRVRRAHTPPASEADPSCDYHN